MSIISKKDAKILRSAGAVMRRIELPSWLNDYRDRLDSIIKGDRWNAHHRKVSMPDMMEEHNGNKIKLQYIKKSVEQAQAALMEANTVLSKYMKCKKCKGKQGEWTTEGHSFMRKHWVDCDGCDCHGYVLK